MNLKCGVEWYNSSVCIRSVSFYAAVGFGIGLGSALTEDHYRQFMGWLRCYENPDMRNLRDQNNRTIWFKVYTGHTT